ncbi:MAG: WD40 repeat domain-containing protein [Pseudomonadota bacterium]|nr:WD40 repeat domain-containing protein [Pseudomonadota bacterium]
MEKKYLLPLLLYSLISYPVWAKDHPPAEPQQAVTAVDVYPLLHPKRDSFETWQEFQQRRKQLLTQFNQAAQKQDPHYQAGTAYLDKDSYDIDSGTFPIKIEWQPWTQEFCLPNQGSITAIRDDARAMWEESQQKPLYIQIKMNQDQLKASQLTLVGLKKNWMVNALPTSVQTTFRPHEQKSLSIAFSPNGHLLAVGSYDHTIKLWQKDSNTLLNTLKGHQDKVLAVAFSPNGKLLVSGSLDQTLKLWRVSNGELIHTLTRHQAGVAAVSFAPNGKMFASASQNGDITLWGGQSLTKELYTLEGQGGVNDIIAIAFSPQGQFFASSHADNTIKFWELGTGKLLKTLNGHRDSIFSLAFSPEGERLASASRDRTIKLWQVNSGKLQHTLQGHENSVYSVSFNPDGRTLASGSADSTIKLWDTYSGKALTTLTGHQEGITAVTFSPNKHILASASFDDTIKLWE